MQIEQEVVHFAGPLLMLLLGDSCTIAHKVCATDPMGTVRAIIAAKAVVHASAAKARPNADLVQGLPPS